MLPSGTVYLKSFARGHGQTGALNGRDVGAFGVARAQADALQCVMEDRFGEAALASVHEGQADFSRFGRIFPGCLGGLNVRILAARNRDWGGIRDGRGVFALGDRQWQVLPRPPSRRRIGEHSRPS